MLWQDIDIDDLLCAAGVDSTSKDQRRDVELVLREHDYRLRETTMKFNVGGQIMLLDVHQ